MDIISLKKYILDNNYIQLILESLNCHHIKHKNGFYQCANPDGDNVTAICVYENEYLYTINYTRNLPAKNRNSDLIDLVCFINNTDFPEGIKYICEQIGISYYHNFYENVPKSFKILEMLNKMSSSADNEDDEPLKPIDECILSYYKKYVNDLFYNDNIDYQTQREFEIGFDEESNRYTIPIRSELGDLVGVKGRYFYRKVPESENKYIYLEPCSKSKILYGLDKTIRFIKQKQRVYVFESEKAVLQLWSMGYKNAVSTGGKKISQHQINMLVRTGADIVLAFDKDVCKEEIESMANNFPDGIPVYYIYDEDNILEDKESPSDNPCKWNYLVNKNIYKIR